MTTRVSVLDASGVIAESTGAKASVARDIIDAIAAHLPATGHHPSRTHPSNTEEPR